MSMNSLGYYEKSYRLMMLPLQNITHVISPVMHPVFSNFQYYYGFAPRRLRSSYSETNGCHPFPYFRSYPYP